MQSSERTMKVIILYSFLFICISPMVLCNVNGDYGGKDNQDKPSITQRFREIALEVGKSSQGPWGKFKSIVYQVQEKFLPPSLDFRSRDGLSNAATVKMTEAVKKSIETSESALEESAGSMSKLVGQAVEKTKEKVKVKISDKDEAADKKDEL